MNLNKYRGYVVEMLSLEKGYNNQFPLQLNTQSLRDSMWELEVDAMILNNVDWK